MELKINEVQLPESIQFNYEELKKELTEKVAKYEGLVYTDDQIKEAKADKANLNKLKKALNDERIRREREYMAPFNEFKGKINEIIAIIDKPVALIDKQVKEYDQKCRADKEFEIVAYWKSLEGKPDWLDIKQIFDERWLNAGTSMKSIRDNIEGWVNRINNEVGVLKELPEFSFEALEEYKRSLDINKAIAEGKRLADIQRRKAEEAEARRKLDEKLAEEARIKAEEEAKKKAEQPQVDPSQFMAPPKEPECEAQWISFSAKLTVAQAMELKEFFVSRNIEFKKA